MEGRLIKVKFCRCYACKIKLEFDMVKYISNEKPLKSPYCSRCYGKKIKEYEESTKIREEIYG